MDIVSLTPEVLAHIAPTVLVALGALGILISTLFTEANTAKGVNEHTITLVATPLALVLVLLVIRTLAPTVATLIALTTQARATVSHIIAHHLLTLGTLVRLLIPIIVNTLLCQRRRCVLLVISTLVLPLKLVAIWGGAHDMTAVIPDTLLPVATFEIWHVAELTVALITADALVVLVDALVIAWLLWTASLADPLVLGPRASQRRAHLVTGRAGQGHDTLVGVLTNGPTGQSIFTGQ